MSTTTSNRPRPKSANPTIVLPDDGPTPLRIPASAFTQRGFCAWAKSDAFPDMGRISYLDGEVWIDMSPEIIETQTLIKAEVGYQIVGLNRREKRGLYLGDRVLLTHGGAGLCTEPDAVFALWSTLESGRLELVPRKNRRDQSKEIRGSPDWVLEVVSDSSLVKDTQHLRELYFKAAIPEYWLVDARGVDLAFTILVRGTSGYIDAPRRGDWQLSPVFGRQFRLGRKQGRLNLWEYTLHHRRPR
jgi:Uma2 family endonuclease